MFEIASRKKLRFNYKGLCTVEDLWDLSQEELNEIYKELMQSKKQNDEVSLLSARKTAQEELLELQCDIVKYIFEVKSEEANLRKKKAENRLKKKHLKELIAQKQNDALINMPIEDLEKMVDELD
jgi:hypothetical protein